MNELLTVRIAAKESATRDICALTLVAADGGALPDFSAGAHLDVHLPGGLVRQYSISNDPAETHRYVLGVLLDAKSRGGSRAVHEQLAPGQVLQVSAPKNHFPLAAHAGRSLLIAGGIGITPILAMARQLARDGSDFELHYAASSVERMAFRAEIEASTWAHAVYFHVGDTRLDVERLLAAQYAGVHVHVCGPKRLIDAVTDAAKRQGWPNEQIHHEFFAGAEPPAAGENRAFEIELARSGRVIPVLADQTAAEALIAAGVPLLTSCEQGVCGTCLTRVLAGAPEHRDLYLTPEEQAANDQFTPCCSRSCSERLVLDLA
ncbi:PDR/VanB family oxidoreductase [Rhizobacter sp. Root1221]|uniref:PDR/VanB family oxidoreductase n=1 Tax=Rhizobacter sp. Root1221 TaxID=1736433 RepID=UPI0006F647B0|nr:PDR/VanB family oxidoreductase [Rhizobacter sp. Root1221]KQV85589.1 Vanillate O-demethylase oxidoreductase [Rhizobacter sp. Root1221]